MGKLELSVWFRRARSSQYLEFFWITANYNPHIQNIDALNTDTHTLRIQSEYTQKQCVGVAIDGMEKGTSHFKNIESPLAIAYLLADFDQN